MSRSRKRPACRVPPPSEKLARLSRVPSTQADHPSWSFRIMDVGGPWCFYRSGYDDLREVIDGLRLYETMTWGEIEGQRDHFISLDRIISNAQKRLQQISQDDVEQLFSLHLGGRPRVWGIRVGAVLRLLWWDKEHEICPSHRRHT